MNSIKELTVSITKLAVKNYVQAREFKTQEAYQRQLWRASLDFYRGDIDAFQFVDDFTTSITEQLTRAWNEGARQVNVDPRAMEDDDLQKLQDIIDSEYNFVEGIAGDIEQASIDKMSIEDFRTRFRGRIDIWSNRYQEVVNTSVQHFSKNRQKLIWNYGDTMHCETCQALNGIVAYAFEWEEAGFHPQEPPNDLLACGGWRCGCEKVPTNNSHTVDALDKLLNIAMSANLEG